MGLVDADGWGFTQDTANEMTKRAAAGANPARQLTKATLHALGLYPAARRANQYLTQYRYHKSSATERRKRRAARYKNGLSFFKPLIAANDLVFDIGAHYGLWTQVFLDLGATVVACEPQIDCLRKLRTRQTAKATTGRLTLVDCAVGAARGNGRLYVRKARGTSGLIENWHPAIPIENVVNVGIVTLDDLINRYGLPKYCKIDVEGYEQEVVKGLTRPIPLMSFEYNIVSGYEIDRTLTCLDYLSRFGKLSINVTPAEHLLFLFREWVDRDYFVDFFIHHLKNLVGFEDYGDIFIRIDR
jgi:FkbM family methyltransferase